MPLKCTRKDRKGTLLKDCPDGCKAICSYYAENSEKRSKAKEQRMGIPKQKWIKLQEYFRQEKRIAAELAKEEEARIRHEEYLRRIEENRILKDKIKQEVWERKLERLKKLMQ